MLPTWSLGTCRSDRWATRTSTMVFVRDEHVDERSALDVGFCFALLVGRPLDKKRTGRIFLDVMNIFLRTTADRDERTKAVTVATAQIPLPLGTLFGHFTRHLHHEHIDELLVLVQRHLQLPLELLANVMRRERRQIATGDHIESQPME